MAEPTPGPWYVDDTGSWPIVRGADQTIVAVRHRLPRDIHAANCHQIAAAPELLAALEAACTFVERHSDPGPGAELVDAWMNDRAWLSHARAAIAKARGEQP